MLEKYDLKVTGVKLYGIQSTCCILGILWKDASVKLKYVITASLALGAPVALLKPGSTENTEARALKTFASDEKEIPSLLPQQTLRAKALLLLLGGTSLRAAIREGKKKAN